MPNGEHDGISGHKVRVYHALDQQPDGCRVKALEYHAYAGQGPGRAVQGSRVPILLEARDTKPWGAKQFVNHGRPRERQGLGAGYFRSRQVRGRLAYLMTGCCWSGLLWLPGTSAMLRHREMRVSTAASRTTLSVSCADPLGRLSGGEGGRELRAREPLVGARGS